MNRVWIKNKRTTQAIYNGTIIKKPLQAMINATCKCILVIFINLTKLIASVNHKPVLRKFLQQCKLMIFSDCGFNKYDE